MKVACLVPYPLQTVPGQRFRLEQWAKPLAKMDVTLEFFPLLDKEVMSFLYEPGRFLAKGSALLRGTLDRARFALSRHLRSFDAVAVHREATLLGIDWIERALVRRLPLIVDFDDAIWLPASSEANRSFSFLRGHGKIDRLLSLASAVSAGCNYLAEHARRHNPRVVVTPTSIDLEAYGPPKVHESKPKLTLGWSGSRTTSAYLSELERPLTLAAKRLGPESLRVVLYGSDRKIHLDGVEVVSIPWSVETEVSVLRTFDVGMKPSAREEWVKGKCPMKDIQYMALGIPPVATRFGTAEESIRPGESGFLCDREEDWVAAIEKLRDPATRVRVGAAARKVVEERYSAETSAGRFREALRVATEA